MQWFLVVLKKYAVFTGRAGKKEYWMFLLFYLIFLVMAGLVSVLLKSQFFLSAYVLALAVPSIAVAVRRLHDLGYSGKWILLSFIPVFNAVTGIVFLILFAREGVKGNNEYGEDPNKVEDEDEDEI